MKRAIVLQRAKPSSSPSRWRVARVPRQTLVRSARFAAAMVLAVLGMMLFAGTASAHDVLISSDPAAGSVQAVAPKAITLTFDETVEQVNPEVAITIGSAKPVVLTPTIADTKVEVDLSGLTGTAAPATGSVLWKIGYRIVSADGHPVTGLVTFSVGHGQAAAAAAVSKSSGAPWVWIVIGVVLIVVIVGALLFLQRMRTRHEAPEPESRSAAGAS